MSDVTAILALTAKMPSGYHRDLQLVKEPLFRILDDARDVLLVMQRAIPGIRFAEERCAAAAKDPALHATAEAYRLVETEGLSFRDAYRAVATRFKSSSAP
jgi:argininosuccinate lyase